MIASARNGFMATNPGDCTGVPFNYEPEYDTAAPANVIPWAALQTNLSTQFEIGHFTPCTQVRGPATFTAGAFSDTYWKRCLGPYERAGRQSAQGEEPNELPLLSQG